MTTTRKNPSRIPYWIPREALSSPLFLSFSLSLVIRLSFPSFDYYLFPFIICCYCCCCSLHYFKLRLKGREEAKEESKKSERKVRNNVGNFPTTPLSISLSSCVLLARASGLPSLLIIHALTVPFTYSLPLPFPLSDSFFLSLCFFRCFKLLEIWVLISFSPRQKALTIDSLSLSLVTSLSPPLRLAKCYYYFKSLPRD